MRVVLHGGFHKTATSHLQNILQRNFNHLEKRGVLYTNHRSIRERYTVPCQRNANLNAGLTPKNRITDELLKEMAADFFAPIIAADPDTLILSDENLYGHCGHIARSGALYHFRKRFVSVFARNIPLTVTDVFLSIRNYPDFFSAAYTEFLRSTRGANAVERFVDIEDTMDKVMSNPPNWKKIIKFASAWFPEARMHVWRFEDFKQLSPQIIQSMCGENVQYEKLRMPGQKVKRPSPSHSAMQEFFRIRHSQGIRTALDQRLELETLMPKDENNPGFDPWSSKNRSLLTELYDRHWLELRESSKFITYSPETRD